MPGRRRRPTVGGVILGVALVGALGVLARGGGYTLYVTAFVVISIIGVLSLNLLMGHAGQVSLGQAALIGSGAYLAAQLTAWNVPFPLVIPGAALATGALGALVGLPSLRIRGLQLAATTLAFGILCERLLFERPWDPTSTLGVAAPRPAALAGDRAFLALALSALAVVALADAA
ncbi:MAG TPA: hypothetical protein VFO65_13320, partial [Acidimicrobiales bacterium]|nr:hypothetical protein [Acidimicrobiales bacterium]